MERKTIQEARKAFLEEYPDGIVDIPKVSKVQSQGNSDLSQIQSELEEIIKKLKT
jgi:hypothetical protein